MLISDTLFAYSKFRCICNDYMAKIGLGIAFVPDYCVKDSSELFILNTKEKMPTRQMVASVNTSLPLSPSTKAFLDLLPTVEN